MHLTCVDDDSALTSNHGHLLPGGAGRFARLKPPANSSRVVDRTLICCEHELGFMKHTMTKKGAMENVCRSKDGSSRHLLQSDSQERIQRSPKEGIDKPAA